MMVRENIFIVVLAVLLCATGCGTGSAPAKPAGFKVSGKVVLPTGGPLSGGTLILKPETGLYGAIAEIQNDGSFALRSTDGSEEVVPGKYQVFLRFPKNANLANAVSPRYQENSGDTDSDVIVEVDSETSSLEIRLRG